MQSYIKNISVPVDERFELGENEPRLIFGKCF